MELCFDDLGFCLDCFCVPVRLKMSSARFPALQWSMVIYIAVYFIVIGAMKMFGQSELDWLFTPSWWMIIVWIVFIVILEFGALLLEKMDGD